MISPASKVSKQKACTNVPIQCSLCDDIHWKYNMRRHLRDRHGKWETSLTKAIQEEIRKKILITIEEEERLCGMVKEWQDESLVQLSTRFVIVYAYTSGLGRPSISTHSTYDVSPAYSITTNTQPSR